MAQLDRLRAIAYVRVSTEDQSNGPEAQRASIEAWAARGGITVARWCSDIGVSGAAPLAKRPGLLEAMGSLGWTNAGVLVAAKRDRLARDVMLAEMLSREVARVGACVRTADGVSDADTPEGRMMRGMLDLFSQYERDIISARTKAGLAAKKARGEQMGGEAPWGFRREGGSLVPDDREREIASVVTELRAAGNSLRGIAAHLADNGYVGRTGKPLSHVQVDRMLRPSAEACAAE